MEIRFLSDLDLIDLHQTFLRAFSDYVVPMNLTVEQFGDLLSRRGARKDLSVAAFYNGKPVGFTLNAFDSYRGLPTVYDVVTGIVPEARRKGIAKEIFEFSLPHLRTMGAKQYVLEVFEKNAPALQLYKSTGFSVARRFMVYTRPESSPSSSDRYSMQLIDPDWKLLESFWDWEPSWQNSTSSMKRARSEKYVVGVFADSSIIGYGIVFPQSGDIPQFAVDQKHRRKGAGRALFHHLQSLVPLGKPTRVVNVDESAKETIDFLRKLGYDLFGTQFEMQMAL